MFARPPMGVMDYLSRALKSALFFLPSEIEPSIANSITCTSYASWRSRSVKSQAFGVRAGTSGLLSAITCMLSSYG